MKKKILNDRNGMRVYLKNFIFYKSKKFKMSIINIIWYIYNINI